MASAAPRSRPRVAFFNPVVAHYRVALVRELWSAGRSDYFLFADTEDPVTGVVAVDLSADGRFTRMRCIRLFRRFTWQAGTVGAAASGDFDAYIFLGNGQWLSTWIAAALARLRGRRVLFWTHGWTRRDRGLKRHLRVAFYRLAHGLLLYGDRARAIALENGFAAERIYVMYNSLDVDAQQRLRADITEAESAALRGDLFGDPTVPAVIATARLTAAKRFDLLIRALAIVNRRVRPTHLILVGDGPERDRLRGLATEQGVRIALIGECYDEARLARLFSAAAVTVSPGNIGLTCMHSLGYGVPVITHDDPDEQGPEYEAITPGITGELFNKGSVEDLAACIARWTRNVTPSPVTRQACLVSVRSRYHPNVQRQVIDRAICDFTGPTQPAGA